MYWKIADLDPSHRERLAAIAASGGAAAPGAYFRSRHNPRRLVVLALLFWGLAVALAAIPVWRPAVWVGAAATAAYGAVCVLALARSGATAIRPFVLVTPAGIVKVGCANGGVEGHQLRDATDFKKVSEYSARQSFNGIAYAFVFPDGTFRVKEKDPAQLRRLDEVLAQARSGAAKGGEPLVPDGGRPGLPFRASLLDPFSAFWIQSWTVVGAIVCLAVLVVLCFR